MPIKNYCWNCANSSKCPRLEYDYPMSDKKCVNWEKMTCRNCYYDQKNNTERCGECESEVKRVDNNRRRFYWKSKLSEVIYEVMNDSWGIHERDN